MFPPPSPLTLALALIMTPSRSLDQIGVVGRTGAGKSSLTMVLYRIIETELGNISIDGVDLRNVDLHTLRSRLSIIPQESQCFAGKSQSMFSSIPPLFSNGGGDEQVPSKRTSILLRRNRTKSFGPLWSIVD